MCLYFKVFPFFIWYFELYLWDKTTLSKPFKLNTYPVMHNYVKNSMQFCKKRRTPYDSVFSLEPPLAAITCNNHFLCHFITENDPLFFAALLPFTELIKHLYMHSSLKVPPQHLNLDFDWVLAAPRFFSFSVTLFCCPCDHSPVAWASLGRALAVDLMFDSSVDSMTASCPSPVAENQVQMLTPPAPCFTAGILCSDFTKHGAVHYAPTSNFGPICPKDIAAAVWWFVQNQLCKPNLCCHVFL